MNSVLILPQHCYTILCWYKHTSHPRGSYQTVMSPCLLGSSLIRVTEWRSPGCCCFSHVSVKTNTQQSLASCCVDRLSWIKSSLFSRERTFESMSVGRAGLVGLALSLARIPPRLPRFRPLSHRLRRCLVRVASVGEAAVSRSGSSSKRRPRSFSVAACESWCLYALPMSKRLRRSYMCFSLWVSGRFTLFGDEQTTLKDIKAPSLGPGAAAASERAAIFLPAPRICP